MSLIKKTTSVQVEKNISEILDSDSTGVGVGSKDIEAVIWSHHHFDHIGDPSTFPPSTELVVGPEFKKHYCPGYPTDTTATLLDTDFHARNVREVRMPKDNDSLKIGGFNAVDYFNDGSFYLLDAPGHSVAHLCGLARVTSSPDSFVFMGADACHHVGLFRPTEYVPLPTTIPSSLSMEEHFAARIGCPGAVLQNLHPLKSVTEPFFQLSDFAFPYYQDACETLRKISEFDATDNVLVIIAHDKSLKEYIDFYPKTINDWKSKGLGVKTRWLFCQDFIPAVEQGSKP